jgi:hypothetical protein
MKRIAFILSILWLALVLTPGAPLAASGNAPAKHTCAMASCMHDCCADGCTCCEGGACTCGASCKCCKDGKCDMKKCEKKCEKECKKAHEEKK